MDWNKISFASESCIWHINFILLFYHHNEYIILSVLVLVHLHVRLHFKTQLEFYACDWITTLSEQQNNQTLKTVFLHFQRLLVVWQATISGHLTFTSLVATYENHSCKQPAAVTDTSRVFSYESFHCIWQKAVAMSHLTRNTAICNMLYVNRDKHNDHPFWMILGMIGLHKSSKTSETFVKIHDILH